MSKAELLPCPFCGGEASDTGHTRYSRPLVDATWPDGSPVTEAFFVNCVRCGAVSRGAGLLNGYQTKAEAITAWNTRAAPAGEAEPVGGDLGALRAPPSIPAVDGERGAAGAVMDALWPLLGGNHTSADLWNEIGEAVGAALSPRPADREAVAVAIDPGALLTDADGCIADPRRRDLALDAADRVLALSRSSAPADPITAGYEAAEGGGMHKNPPQEGSK